MVSVTSHWADGTRHVPLGVRAYRPASRLPKGKTDPSFHTKPELAWELIEEARAAGIPFRVVLGDCVYGENPKLEGRLFTAGRCTGSRERRLGTRRAAGVRWQGMSKSGAE
jgi:SRSO17 transposase